MSKEALRSNESIDVPGRRYDLEERTAQFGEAILQFARKITIGPVTEPLIGQIVRAATSIGANSCEADDAGSRKGFRYRISVRKREARESKHWLRMIATAVPALNEEARTHSREAKGLHLVFNAVCHKTEFPKETGS